MITIGRLGARIAAEVTALCDVGTVTPAHAINALYNNIPVFCLAPDGHVSSNASFYENGWLENYRSWDVYLAHQGDHGVRNFFPTDENGIV